MDMTIAVILFVLFLLIIVLFRQFYHADREYVVSPHNQKQYLVRSLENKEDAAILLSKVGEKLKKLIDRLAKAYPKDSRVKLLAKRFNQYSLSETPGYSTYTSYSVNKGEKLVFCIRNRKNPLEFIDTNTLLFVALHELGHIMTLSIGHNEEFWLNFRFLLAHAIHWKIYTPQNFRDNPKRYCGMTITDSPLQEGDKARFVNFES